MTEGSHLPSCWSHDALLLMYHWPWLHGEVLSSAYWTVKIAHFEVFLQHTFKALGHGLHCKFGHIYDHSKSYRTNVATFVMSCHEYCYVLVRVINQHLQEMPNWSRFISIQAVLHVNDTGVKNSVSTHNMSCIHEMISQLSICYSDILNRVYFCYKSCKSAPILCVWSSWCTNTCFIWESSITSISALNGLETFGLYCTPSTMNSPFFHSRVLLVCIS